MTDRVERVILEAITGAYDAAMIRSGLVTAGAESRVGAFGRQVKNADVSSKGIITTLSGVSGGTLAVGAAAAIGTAALVKMGADGVKAYVNLANEVRGYQRVAGGSAEESSRMVAALHAVGLEGHAGALALFRLSNNVDKHAESLKAAGVEVVRDAAGNVDLNETLLSLSDSFRRIEDPQQRSVLLMNALGRGAVTLAPLLAVGRERIEEFWAAAARHHEILSQDDLDKARELKFATHELSEAWGSFERQLGQDAVPFVTKGVHFLTTELDGTQKIANFLGRGLGGLTGIHLHHASAARADADAVEQENQRLKEAAQSADDFKKSLAALMSQSLGVSSAQGKFSGDLIEFADTIRAAEAAGDSYAKSLDNTTATGIANQQMLQGLVKDIVDTATAARDAAAAQGASAADQDRVVTNATASQRLQLARVVEQLGLNQDSVRKYTSVLEAIDGMSVMSTVELEEADARFVKENEGVPSGIASPALLDARNRVGGYLAGPDPTPGLDQALAGQGPKATGAAGDGGDFLEALQRQKWEQVENRFKEGKASLEEYDRALDEQLAREKPWTDEWVALQQKKADAAHYWTDATTKYLEGLAEKQAHLEDNMAEVGDIATDAYVQILERRLAALQKYSDEWVRVYKEIQQLQDNALEGQLKIIEAYEAGRQFQLGFDQLAQQRAMYGQLTPASGGGTTTIIHSTSWSPSFTANGSDAQQAMDTSAQKLRDFAVSR